MQISARGMQFFFFIIPYLLTILHDLLGYNLYLSGGEFGIGSGRFNKKVWRYSLISKNWFLETT